MLLLWFIRPRPAYPHAVTSTAFMRGSRPSLPITRPPHQASSLYGVDVSQISYAWRIISHCFITHPSLTLPNVRNFCAVSGVDSTGFPARYPRQTPQTSHHPAVLLWQHDSSTALLLPEELSSRVSYVLMEVRRIGLDRLVIVVRWFPYTVVSMTAPKPLSIRSTLKF